MLQAEIVGATADHRTLVLRANNDEKVALTNLIRFADKTPNPEAFGNMEVVDTGLVGRVRGLDNAEAVKLYDWIEKMGDALLEGPKEITVIADILIAGELPEGVTLDAVKEAALAEVDRLVAEGKTGGVFRIPLPQPQPVPAVGDLVGDLVDALLGTLPPTPGCDCPACTRKRAQGQQDMSPEMADWMRLGRE
jgi:hypothetical protein